MTDVNSLFGRSENETLRLAWRRVELTTLIRKASTREGVLEQRLRTGNRRPDVVRARRLFCQVAVQGRGWRDSSV